MRANHARHASQTCEACEPGESDMRGMRVMHKIFSYDVKSNKKTDKGVGVYFKGQNVESVLSSQESNIYHRPKPDEPTTYQGHLV